MTHDHQTSSYDSPDVFSFNDNDPSFGNPVVVTSGQDHTCRLICHTVSVGICTILAFGFLSMVVTMASLPTLAGDSVPGNIAKADLYKSTPLNVSTAGDFVGPQKFIQVSLKDLPNDGDDVVSVCSFLSSNSTITSEARLGLYPITMVNGMSSYSTLEVEVYPTIVPPCSTGEVAKFTICDKSAPYIWISATAESDSDVSATFLLSQDTCNGFCSCNENYYYGWIGGIVALTIISVFLLISLCVLCCCLGCCIISLRKRNAAVNNAAVVMSYAPL